jgi:hypothetical protein
LGNPFYEIRTGPRYPRAEHGFFAGSGGAAVGSVTFLVWALDAPQAPNDGSANRRPCSAIGGTLATAGGLALRTSGGSLFALDATTAKELWLVGHGGIT